jgi:hypothetical protein
MLADVPAASGRRGAPSSRSTGRRARGEYYTFQVGVWAHRGAVDSMRYTSDGLTRSAAALGGSARGR